MSGFILTEKAALRNAPAQNVAAREPHSPSAGSSLARDAVTLGGSEPEADDGSLYQEINSLQHTTALPPYSGPSTCSIATPQTDGEREGAARQHGQFAGIPRLDYKLYSPPLFQLSKDCITLESNAPYLSANVTALVNTMRQLASVPPKPQVQVMGSRGRRLDFNLKLNLMPLLVPEDASMRMDYLRCVYPGELALRGGSKPSSTPDLGSDEGLEGWARRFVEDPARFKSFTLERQVANLDVAYIEGQIRMMLASAKYKGNVTISFPITHARVVVNSPDRVNKLFSAIGTVFSGKNQYEVVKAVWPFASATNGQDGRRCVVQSEEAWWREWKDPVKYAVSTKRQGWVTNEDKLEAVMEGKGKGVVVVDWGPDNE